MGGSIPQIAFMKMKRRHDMLLVAIAIPAILVLVVVLIGFIFFISTGPHFVK